MDVHIIGPMVRFIFKEYIEDKIMSIEPRGCNYRTMNKKEGKALKYLKSYRDIVIKEADEGSAFWCGN